MTWEEANAAINEVNSRYIEHNRKRFIVQMILNSLARTEGEHSADCLNYKYDLIYSSEGGHPYFDKSQRKPLDPTQDPCGEYLPVSNINAAVMAEIARAVRKETVRSGSRKKG